MLSFGRDMGHEINRSRSRYSASDYDRGSWAIKGHVDDFHGDGGVRGGDEGESSDGETMGGNGGATPVLPGQPATPEDGAAPKCWGVPN